MGRLKCSEASTETLRVRDPFGFLNFVIDVTHVHEYA